MQDLKVAFTDLLVFFHTWYIHCTEELLKHLNLCLISSPYKQNAFHEKNCRMQPLRPQKKLNYDRTIHSTNNRLYRRIQKKLKRASLKNKCRQDLQNILKYQVKGKRSPGRHLKWWEDSCHETPVNTLEVMMITGSWYHIHMPVPLNNELHGAETLRSWLQLSQRISHLLWNSKLHYCVHNSSLLAPIQAT